MKLTAIQKTKIVLFLNFFALFVLIISTPYFIREGFGPFSESFVEGVFLTVQLFALYFMFRHYDVIIEKKEDENFALSAKLKRKEQELINVFQHIGKVNVQVSMIKAIFEKIRVPSNKKELKLVYGEFLRLVCAVAGEKKAGMRIIDLKSGRTLGEFFSSEEGIWKDLPFGNHDLIDFYERKTTTMNDFSVFFTDAKNFSIKVFIYTTNYSKKEFTKEEKELMGMIANQCEIFFLLLFLQHKK